MAQEYKLSYTGLEIDRRLSAIDNLAEKEHTHEEYLTEHLDISGKADRTELENKISVIDPNGTGSFSLNRASNSVVGPNSIAMGTDAKASGVSSVAIGFTVESSGLRAFAEGAFTSATGIDSHAEGTSTEASGDSSHAEGENSIASSYGAHAEGGNTTASGDYSHAEGCQTIASGSYSHAEGAKTKASSIYQHVQGRLNIEDTANIYAHIVGNGQENQTFSNAHTLDWSGNAWYAGDVYVGSTSGINKDEGSKKLATENFVTTEISIKADKTYVDTQDTTILTDAKSYTDIKVASLVDSAPETLNTLNELAAALGDDPNFATTTANQIGTKANASDLTSHTGNKSNPHGVSLTQLGVTATAAELNIMDGITATTKELNYVDGVTSNIQTLLNGKAASSHGTHVTYSTTAPVVDGTASAGSASTVARSDHKHPTDTTRAAASDLTSHTGNTTVHITAAERTAWNNKSNFSGNYNDLTNKPTIPTVPVQSVNGKTGAVQLTASDVGAAGKTSDNTFTGKNVFTATSLFDTLDTQKFVVGDSGSAFVFGNDGLQTFTGTASTTPKDMYINYYGGDVVIGKAGGTQNIKIQGVPTLSGNTVIIGNSSDTPLYVQSKVNAAYIGFKNSNATALGYYGVNSVGQPVFYNTKDNIILHAGNYSSFAAPAYTYGTDDLVAGSSPLATGKLYFVYE